MSTLTPAVARYQNEHLQEVLDSINPEELLKIDFKKRVCINTLVILKGVMVILDLPPLEETVKDVLKRPEQFIE